MKERINGVSRIEKERVALSRSGVGVQGFMNYSASDMGGYKHSHDFVEMVFLMRGELWNEIDGNRFIQHEGELAVVNYGSSHSLFCHKADLYNIYLDMGIFPLKQLAPEILSLLEPVLMPHPGVVNRRNRIRYFPLDNPAFTGSLIKRMEQYSRKEEEGERALFHSMNLFLSELALSLKPLFYEGKSVPFLEKSPVRSVDPQGVKEDMERVIGIIERDFSLELDMETLAQGASCSKSHLCRKFKAYTGLSVGDYLLERRLRQAMYLLRSTNDKITYIAGESGFNQMAHFNRKFRSYTGMSAGEFRKRGE